MGVKPGVHVRYKCKRKSVQMQPSSRVQRKRKESE